MPFSLLLFKIWGFYKQGYKCKGKIHPVPRQRCRYTLSFKESSFNTIDSRPSHTHTHTRDPDPQSAVVNVINTATRPDIPPSFYRTRSRVHRQLDPREGAALHKNTRQPPHHPPSYVLILFHYQQTEEQLLERSMLLSYAITRPSSWSPGTSGESPQVHSGSAYRCSLKSWQVFIKHLSCIATTVINAPF